MHLQSKLASPKLSETDGRTLRSVRRCLANTVFLLETFPREMGCVPQPELVNVPGLLGFVPDLAESDRRLFTFIYIHDLHHKIAKEREHLHEEAIHVACWLSLSMIHAEQRLMITSGMSQKNVQHALAIVAAPEI
jgi:hypothetical protein